MWYFQRKNTVDLSIFYYILLLTTCSHLCLLVILFFIHHTENQQFTIVIQHAVPHHTDFTLYTIQPRPIKQTTINPTKTSNNAKSISIDKKAVSPVIKPTAQKQPEKILTAVNSIKKTAAIEAKKEPTTLKKTTVHEEKKDNSSTKKMPDTKPLQKTKSKEESFEKKETFLQKTEHQQDATVDNTTLKEVSLDELELLRKIDYLQQELLSAWHPPIVQKSNPSCTLELSVNWQGGIESIIIKQTSGILIFDTAARNAVRNMHIPLWAKGKSITITLKA
ncbi:hypothetical protein EKK58_02950 [Candidatus Dependentiae bacterium]|nr:MAG: hypothetical protein EKK58_02950 [Candidatus Dependentiae bacterium]